MRFYSIWTDLGEGKPDFVDSNFDNNLGYFDKGKLIDEDEYNYLLDEAFKDYRVKSMYKQRNGKNQFDVFRTWYEWKYPNEVYIDCDVYLEKELEIKTNKPAFARFAGDKIDGFICAPNGDGEFFNRILNRMYKVHQDFCFPQILHLPQNWDNVIEEEYFTHEKVVHV